MKSLFKQISTIAFLMYYVAISSGINISLHYCAGELSDIAIISHNTYCQMHDSNSCEGSCVSSTETTHHQCEVEEQHQCCDNTDVYVALEANPLFSERNFIVESNALKFDILELLNNIETQDEVIICNCNTEAIVSYPPPYLAFHKLILYA